MPKPVAAPIQAPTVAGSLRTTATVIENDDRLLDGVSFRPELCGTGGIIELCPDDPVTKTISDPLGPVTAPTYAMWEGDTCSTLTRDAFGEGLRRVQQRLEQSTSFYLETALWTGSPSSGITDSSALASTAADDITPAAGAVGIVPALRDLVLNLNDALHGSRGIIHVPQYVVPYLEFYGQIVRQGNVLQLAGTDHVLIAGTGYPGTDPDGNDPADGEAWLYGTGAVVVRLSSIDLLPTEEFQAIDRSVNDVDVRAERAGAAYFDPCAHLAINVCLPDPGPACDAS